MQKLFLLFILLTAPLATMALESNTTSTSPYLQVTGSHPRLYITTNKIDYIRTKLIEYPYSKFWDITKKKADEYTIEKTPSTISQMNDGAIRKYGDHIPFMAFAFLITREEKYLNGTRRWMNALASYKNWASNTDLGAAHLLFGMSIAYDWLYEKWSEDERARFKQKILKQANILNTALAKENIWWSRTEYLMQNHNYTNVMSIAIAGIALQGEAPKVNIWLTNAEDNFQQVLQLLSPDGASHEGVGYWGYGMVSLLKYYLVSPKINRYKIIKKTPYFQNASKYRLYASLPGYKENVDYADSPRYDWQGPGYNLRALASIFNDGKAQWLAEKIEKVRGINPYDSWLNLIWYDETIIPVSPNNLPTFSYFDNLGIFISRSSWSDDATWVFFKAGPSQGKIAEAKGIYTGSHIHPDAGTFLIWAQGNWLVIDDGNVYKKRTENHNVLLLNGIGQLGEGDKWFNPSTAKKHSATSKITHVDLQEKYQYLVAEIGSMYPPEAGVKKWNRSFIWIPPKNLIIHDEITMNKSGQATGLIHTSIKPRALSLNKACLLVKDHAGIVISDISINDSNMTLGAYKLKDKETSSSSNNSGGIIKISSNNTNQTVSLTINRDGCIINKSDSTYFVDGNIIIDSSETRVNIDLKSKKVLLVSKPK